MKRMMTLRAVVALNCAILAGPALHGKPTKAGKFDTSLIDVEVRKMEKSGGLGDEKLACYKFRIKNNSSETIYKLTLTLFFINSKGEEFFEHDTYPVLSNRYRNKPLKPKYSIVDSGCIDEDRGIDVDEWAEGKVRLLIKAVVTQPPREP